MISLIIKLFSSMVAYSQIIFIVNKCLIAFIFSVFTWKQEFATYFFTYMHSRNINISLLKFIFKID